MFDIFDDKSFKGALGALDIYRILVGNNLVILINGHLKSLSKILFRP